MVTGVDVLSPVHDAAAGRVTAVRYRPRALDAALAGGEDGLARRFFRAAAKVIDAPWRLSDI